MSEFAEGMPTVTVTLDRERELGFTLGAMRRIRDRLGTVEFDPNSDDLERVLPAYVWACLPSSGRAELSPERIEDLIHFGNMQQVVEALSRLLARSLPEEQENPTPAGEQPALATG